MKTMFRKMLTAAFNFIGSKVPTFEMAPVVAVPHNNDANGKAKGPWISIEVKPKGEPAIRFGVDPTHLAACCQADGITILNTVGDGTEVNLEGISLSHEGGNVFHAERV